MRFGLYWCVWVMPAQTQNALIKQFLHNHSSARNTLSEFVLSHTCARRLFPGLPTACYSNVDKPRSLAGISWTRVDDRPLHPWVAKLSALLSSPFERTVFLDNDVYLLRNDFLASMVAIARHSDVAMPIDPKRYHVPMGCTAIVNYNTTRARAFFSAARQLLASDAEFPNAMRRGDQEALWLTWTGTSVASTLRVFLLPDEYYCYWNKYSTSWRAGRSTYRCYAWHGHGYNWRQVLKHQDAPSR